MSDSPISVDVSADAKAVYERKRTHQIYEIRIQDFEPCHPREIRKRKWILFEDVFVVHVKTNGYIDFKVLK